MVNVPSAFDEMRSLAVQSARNVSSDQKQCCPKRMEIHKQYKQLFACQRFNRIHARGLTSRKIAKN